MEPNNYEALFSGTLIAMIIHYIYLDETPDALRMRIKSFDKRFVFSIVDTINKDSQRYLISQTKRKPSSINEQYTRQKKYLYTFCFSVVP